MNKEIKEIKINKANKSITFINNGIAFSQFGIAEEILDLITNLEQEINVTEKSCAYWEERADSAEEKIDKAINILELSSQNKGICSCIETDTIQSALKELKEGK